MSKRKRPHARRAHRRSTALVRRVPTTPAVSPEVLALEAANPTLGLIRLARDKSVDAAKLEKIIDMQERLAAAQAKQAFDQAFIDMRAELPVLAQRGDLKNKQGAVQSHYDTNVDTETLLTPILHKFGFSLSYRTEWPAVGVLEVVGVLTHRDGHTRESRFQAQADDTGGKNFIQGLGSAVQYGHRYTRRDLLNLVAAQDPTDDGGRAAAGRRRDRAPAVDVPAAHHDATQDEPISDKQRNRLWVIIKHAGRQEQDVKAWLAVAYNLDSTKKIPRRLYETICTAIEHPGPLPPPPAAPRTREPGEEG